jgi:wyosine [tRNA(Phe)-imidazoG37] synthetase (radical SAM superfamily)
MQIKRQAFYEPEDVFEDVREKVEKLRAAREDIDYLSFVPDGEATLDINLGRLIDRLKPLGIKIAVLTNGSLMDDPEVRKDVKKADLVSLKVDAVLERAWRLTDRPHGRLRLPAILDGMLRFAGEYGGRLITETLLIHRTNDYEKDLEAVAGFLARLKPDVAYISVPIRPPTEDWVREPTEDAINLAYQIFSRKLDNVECLLGSEGNAFAFTGDVEEDILSITAVHPMREEALRDLLERAGSDWSVVEKMLANEQLVEITHEDSKFFLRKLEPVKRKTGQQQPEQT